MSPVVVTSLLKALQRNCHSNPRFLPLLLSPCYGRNILSDSDADATAIQSSTSGISCNKCAIERRYYSYRNYNVKTPTTYQQGEVTRHQNKDIKTYSTYNNCSRNPSSLCSLRNYRTSSTSTTTKQVCSASKSLLTSRLSGSRLLPVVHRPTSAASCASTASASSLHTSAAMAKSKFEYVRQFETDDMCLPNCWLVVRIDGKSFHKFTDTHHYMKPNDDRGLGLMSRAAQHVMGEFTEIVLAYGQSDEYSFVFHKASKLYNRRASKIMTNLVSLFASSFTLYWPRFFNTQELQYPPSFDARVVLYPSDENLKDYLSWRQADCHINNLYNTCFWKLVQEKGLSPAGAQERLKGTLSSDKNEILYTEFNINYNNLPELYRKGTVLIRPRDTESDSAIESPISVSNSRGPQRSKGKNQRPSSVVLHCDIIGKQFWVEHPDILGSKRPT